MKLVALVVLVSGCTHEMGTIATMPAAQMSNTEVTVSPPGSNDDTEIEATIVATPGGSFVLYDHAGRQIPASAVGTIAQTSHAYGALEGLGAGALSGAALGAILGFMAGSDPPCDGDACLWSMTAGEKAAFGAVLLGGLGGLVGVLVGAALGQDDVWRRDGGTEMNPAIHPQPRIQPSGPPGSAAGLTLRW